MPFLSRRAKVKLAENEISWLERSAQSRSDEVGQGGERTRGEEARPCVLNGALHAPFFIASRGTAGAGGEVVVGGEFQQTGMEVIGVAAAFEHHAF